MALELNMVVVPKNPREWNRLAEAANTTPGAASVTVDLLAADTITLIDTKAADAGAAAVATHVATTDPHPVYTTDAEALVIATNTANSAVSNHVLQADPHTQYLTESAAAATYAVLETSATYTGAFTGCATDPAPVIRYSRVGKIVVLYFPQTNAVSNSTAFTITGAPASIRPTRTQTVIAIVRDNSAPSIGTASMDSSGVLTFGVGVSSGIFTGSGNKGVELNSITYALD